MEALQGQTIIQVKRHGDFLGDVSYDILKESGTPVFKASGNLKLFDTKRFFSLNPLIGDESGWQLKSSGGLCGCRRLALYSKTGSILGVLRSSFSLWGMSFIVEDPQGMEVFKVRQIGKFSISENSFEILTVQEIFVGKLTQYYDGCSSSPKSYKLDLVAPFDANSSLIFLATVFFLEDSLSSRLIRSIIIIILELILLGILIGIIVAELD